MTNINHFLTRIYIQIKPNWSQISAKWRMCWFGVYTDQGLSALSRKIPRKSCVGDSIHKLTDTFNCLPDRRAVLFKKKQTKRLLIVRSNNSFNSAKNILR